jgi:hypothetical protein
MDPPHLYRGMGQRAALRALPALAEEVRAGRRDDIRLPGCGLTAVPDVLRGLTRLRYLDLADNRLTELPAWLGELTRLQVLTLDRNRVDALPDSIGALTRLAILHVDHNRLTAVPTPMSRLTALERLSLAGNRLTALPPIPPGLACLNLDANRLATLPDDLRGLAGLEQLHLRGNRLARLPGAVADLTTLWLLDLDANRLTTLPDTLDRLTRLRVLRLSDNRLATVPPVLCRMTGLESLHLARNGLTEVPDILPDLKRLDLADNLLTTPHSGETGGNPVNPWSPPPPQTLNLERRSAQYRLVIGGLMGWFWSGTKDSLDESAHAVSLLPRLSGRERTDAEDLVIMLVREGRTSFAYLLAQARCVRSAPLLREIADDPCRPAHQRREAEQALDTLNRRSR